MARKVVRILYNCTLFLLILSSNFYTQTVELNLQIYPVEEGMPTGINYILQDKTGYLWFATNSGLYKYDGYNFTSFKHDINDPSSIIDNSLNTIYEDMEGNLWIGTWLGVEKFDRLKNKFLHYTPNPSENASPENNHVWTICEDKYGFIWVGTSDGLYRFDKTKEGFTSFSYNRNDYGSISDNEFGSICKDKKGSLWFGTQVGLDRFDYETGKFSHYWIDEKNRFMNWDYVSEFRINIIFEDDSGVLWFGTNKGLVEFNSETGTFVNYLPDKQRVRITSISQDVVTGSLWIASESGLLSFDRKSKVFTKYKSEATVVCSEISGSLWIGTNSEIKKLNRTKQPFTMYTTPNNTHATTNGRNGILWVFSFGEWFKKFDIKKEQFVPYSFGGDFLYYIYPEGDMAFLKEDGTFYISDTLGNVQFLSGPQNRELNLNLSFGWKTKRGYYVGSHNGCLYLFEPKTNQIKKIKDFKDAVYYIYEDSAGLLWVATYMGKLYCYNQEQDTTIQFISNVKSLSNSGRRQINYIYEDKKGRLWFAAITGLTRYERSTNSFIHLTEKDGLPVNNVFCMIEDKHGYLWLNTSKGISRFDPETNRFKNYDVSYGISPPTDAYYGVGCITRSGEIYFPGSKGITRFHPDSIKDNPYIPPIVITSFKKFDKPYPLSRWINLPYNDNFISFEFAALSFVSQERNQYAYMMEGLDDQWVYSGTRRYVSYPNLAPGKYVFRVKGSNNDGVWNETGASVLIIISPPWWKTSLAYFIYVSLILIIIYFTWRMQVKRLRISHEYKMSKFEAEKLHELDEMKSKFFTNISHEFRTPLTLILGPVKQIIERTKEVNTREELGIVRRNAERLLSLVNQLLDISRIESGNMKLRTSLQDIIPLLKALLQSFCSYAERKKISLSFSSAEDSITAYIDNDKFEKIITNILSNAFKFTPEGGTVSISVTRSAQRNTDYTIISVRDSGIGIPKEKLSKIFDRFYQVDSSHTREHEGTGIGLSLTRELVELHKGTIRAESKEGEGTEITVSIPLGKDHLNPEEICEPESKDTITGTERIDFQDELVNGNKPDIFQESLTGKPSLLIVEDNSDVRNYIKNNLRDYYNITEAADGEEGWNKSCSILPDLIISDVMMPKIDGFKLCDKLKTDERTSHIPVILLTAKASAGDKIEGLETGADDYLMKPFETEELKARIRNLIEQRKRIHEHFRKHGLFEVEEENITPVDKKFLQKVFSVINQYLSDTSFGVEKLAEEMAVSRSLLLKKVESLTGESPHELIKRIRLRKAANLIENKFGNISEIALETGFTNPSHFANSFKKQYGISPSRYLHVKQPT